MQIEIILMPACGSRTLLLFEPVHCSANDSEKDHTN